MISERYADRPGDLIVLPDAWHPYPTAGLALSVERIPIDDSRMSPAWGDHLNRVVANPTDAPRSGTLRITVNAPQPAIGHATVA